MGSWSCCTPSWGGGGGVHPYISHIGMCRPIRDLCGEQCYPSYEQLGPVVLHPSELTPFFLKIPLTWRKKQISKIKNIKERRRKLSWESSLWVSSLPLTKPFLLSRNNLQFFCDSFFKLMNKLLLTDTMENLGHEENQSQNHLTKTNQFIDYTFDSQGPHIYIQHIYVSSVQPLYT